MENVHCLSHPLFKKIPLTFSEDCTTNNFFTQFSVVILSVVICYSITDPFIRIRKVLWVNLTHCGSKVEIQTHRRRMFEKSVIIIMTSEWVYCNYMGHECLHDKLGLV